MQNFTDVSGLKAYIDGEISRVSHSPVRFINVETMDMWVQVKSYLTTKTSASIKLSDFCETDDTTPNIIRLKNALKNLDKNAVVIPLSEHLRVNLPSAMQTFNDILNIDFQNNDNNLLKIYIPVYRMKSIVQNISLDTRNKDCIIYLDTDSDCDYSLTIVQNTLKAKLCGNEITGYKKYLSYWEQNPDKPIVLHTQNAIHYSDVVFADDVQVIVTAYQLLRFHHSLPEAIKNEWGLDEDWQMLVDNYGGQKNFDSAMCNLLLTSKFDIKLFERWNEKDQFTKWLIWLWAKIKINSGYLGLVLEKCLSLSEFVDKIYSEIISETGAIFFNYYSERYLLLHDMKLLPTAPYFDKLNTLDIMDKLKCLTTLTEKETAEIYFTLQCLGIDEQVLDILRVIYPELAIYLANEDFESERLNDYFKQYKIQKATNKVFDEFITLVNEIATEQCEELWKLPSRNVEVSSQYESDTTILFVDALGAEYIGVLEFLLKQKGLEVNHKVGWCNIPSTTAQNKDFFDGKDNVTYYELDKLKHSGHSYPVSVIKEFEELQTVANKAVEILCGKKRVIIASDHGTSRLAILAKGQSYKIKDESKLYKYGRYCVDPVNDYTTCEGCINKDNYWIFANYNRFSSQGAALLETHGGASWEECIVPIICVEKPNGGVKKLAQKEIIIVSLITPEVKLSLDKKVRVGFALSKSLEDVVAVVNNKRYKCEIIDNAYWFEPDVGKDETYAAKISCKEIIGEVQYRVIKGISSNFDI